MDKPLHVRVAEALGCRAEFHPEWDAAFPWFCRCDHSDHSGKDAGGRIADYDTD